MAHQSFEIAPPTRSILWDQALTIAFTPAVTLFACVTYFTGEIPMATVSAVVAFGGTLLFAIPLARPRLGRITLHDDALEISSGFLRARLPLDQFDLSAARRATADARSDASCLSLTTASQHLVILPRRDGELVQVSPADPNAFLAALIARTHR